SVYGGMLSYNLFRTEDKQVKGKKIKGWFVDLTGSVSHERSRVTPSLGVASDVDMDLWSIGINIHRSDELSNTSLMFNRTQSMGGSNRDDFQKARLETEPDFAIYNLSAAHSQFLDPDRINRLNGSFHFITSDERLVPAKMTLFGGFYSVRGYKEYEIVADGGVLASIQYEFDLVKYDQKAEGTSIAGGPARGDKSQAQKPWLRRLAPLAFIDYGRAKTNSPVAGEQDVRELCSIGTGAIVVLGDNFMGTIYYGWPLRETDETDRYDGRFNFSFLYRF
ncbi:MAG: hypothetical protein MUO75_07500, partial [Actinobacteria bacterium]|nr:hypothetical protein [Actinomycetota bacterium]